MRRPIFSQRALFSMDDIRVTVTKSTAGEAVFNYFWQKVGGSRFVTSGVRVDGTTPKTITRTGLAAGTWQLSIVLVSGEVPFNLTVVTSKNNRSTPTFTHLGHLIRVAEFTIAGEAPEAAPEPEPTAPAPVQPSAPAETMKPATPANTNTAATTTAAKNQKPRYRVISTVNRTGSQTEAVRELTPRQVADYRNRGFEVQQVADSVPLHSPIVYRSVPRPQTTPVLRRERSSRPRGNPVKPQWADIAGRRERSHNRLVSIATNYNFRRLGQDGRVYDYIGHPKRTLDYFRNQNFNLYNVRSTSDNSQRTDIITGAEASRWKRGKTAFKTGGYAGGNSSGGGSTNGGGSSGGGGSSNGGGSSGDTSQEANRLEGELRTLTAQLKEINERTSQQLIDLGQSTVDRDNQIQALDRWTQEQLTRIDQSLVALGNAQKDASAGIDSSAQATLAAVQQQIDALKASIESASKSGGSSILGGLFNTSNLPIILILVVVLLVMIRK